MACVSCGEGETSVTLKNQQSQLVVETQYCRECWKKMQEDKP